MSILNINYFCHFLVTLQNLNPMDDEPMWTTDCVFALTQGSAINIREAANEFAIKGSEILHSIKGTILEEIRFAEFDEFMPMTTDENSKSESATKEPPFEKITFNTNYKVKTSLEEPPMDLALKPPLELMLFKTSRKWTKGLLLLVEDTNESVSVVPSVFAASTKALVFALPNVDNLSDVVIYSFFTSQSNSPQLDNEDLNQVDADDLKEMDLKWQMNATITIDKAILLENAGHLGTPEIKTLKEELFQQRLLLLMLWCHTVMELVAMIRAFRHEEPTNYALMAFTSSNLSSSDNEIASCSKACSKAYATLQSHYDKLTVDFKKSQFDVLSYKPELRKKFEKAKKERDEFKQALENIQTSSKNLNDSVPTSPVHASETVPNVFHVKPSTTKPNKDMSQSNRPFDPIIKDWVSDSEDESKERKNRTLIEAARTMLADSLLSIPFWAEVVNTACYVQNMVLVTKPHNKTPYELLLGKTTSIGFMRPLGCIVTILNTLDPLGKFNGKADEGFLVGYSILSKAFRVFNGSRPKWLFDIDTFTQSINYQPVVIGNQPNHNAGIQGNFDACKVVKEAKSAQQYVLLPLWSTSSKDPQNSDADAVVDVKDNDPKVHVSPSSSDKPKKHDEKAKREAKRKRHVDLSTRVKYLRDEFKEVSVNSTNRVNAASVPVSAVGPNSTNNTNNFNAAGPSNNDVSSKFEIGFEELDYPDKVYKVVKVLYGLHQAPRAWYETLANYLLENGFQRGKIDRTLFIKKQQGDILLVQAYVDDIIFGSTNKELCQVFKKLMKDKFQMSSIGELTLFVRLQVKQKDDGIFISQDKYIAKTLRKFGLTYGKSASTPIDTEKPLLKDLD
nr:putative ribonuclease H-like domain-containing protein [Tanacetum cinerariifolium]